MTTTTNRIERLEKAGIVLLANPEPCPGSYSLDMYCKYSNPAHDFREFPHEFGRGCESGREARSAARRYGWIIHLDGTATCPKCAIVLRARGVS